MITLLITTHNRGRLLRTSLERLADLTLPDEVLVVDDGGNDETEDVCRELSSRLPVRYVYHNNPGQTICSFARNVGLKLAQGDLVVTSEPELVFKTDAIAQFLALHEEDPERIISAGTLYFANSSAPGWQHAPGDNFRKETGWVATYTALYRRDWLFEVGGWDEEFPGPWGWDDTDLLTRLRLRGYGQRIAPEVEVVHQWHPLGADVNSANDHYFHAKSFQADEANHDLVVANRGREWGSLKPR